MVIGSVPGRGSPRSSSCAGTLKLMLAHASTVMPNAGNTALPGNLSDVRGVIPRGTQQRCGEDAKEAAVYTEINNSTPKSYSLYLTYTLITYDPPSPVLICKNHAQILRNQMFLGLRCA